MAPTPSHRQVGQRVRTAEGTLVVDGDGVTLDASLQGLITGVRERWRDGERRPLAWLAVRSLSQLGLLASTVSAFGGASSGGVDIALGLQVTGIVALVSALWYRGTRRKTIPAARIRRVELDDDERELTVVYERPDGFFDALRDGPAERSAQILPGSVADARATIRAAGRAAGYEVAVGNQKRAGGEGSEERTNDQEGGSRDGSPDGRRVAVRNGAEFCEDCGLRVSPDGRDCPWCGYALGVNVKAGEGTDAGSGDGDDETRRPRTEPERDGAATVVGRDLN